MKATIIIALLILTSVHCKGQGNKNDQASVIVAGKELKEILPIGYYMFFTVQQSRDYDTNKLKTYEQAFKDLQEFVKESKIKAELEFVKRFASDFPGFDDFGMFRFAVADREIARELGDKLSIAGVEVERSRYRYQIDTPAIRAEMTRAALQNGKLRASEIASGVNMELGNIIQLQEPDHGDANFFETESDNPVQTISVTVYLAFELVPMK